MTMNYLNAWKQHGIYYYAENQNPSSRHNRYMQRLKS